MQTPDGPKKLTCPHCEKEFVANIVVRVPEESTLIIRVETEEGMPLAAETLGALLTHTSKCLKEVAKGIGESVGVFITKVEIDGTVAEATLTVLRGAKKPKRKGARPC